jgi:cytidine deaminase
MKIIKFNSTAHSYASADELENADRLLLDKAESASHNAYAPYSHFRVGAAVLLDNGLIVTGNNQENAAYPSGLCAERVAVFAAMSQHPNAVVKAIAITANSDAFIVDTPVTPCGSCRQVIAEYEHKSQSGIKLILGGATGKILIFENMGALLPFAFDAGKLKK